MGGGRGGWGSGCGDADGYFMSDSGAAGVRCIGCAYELDGIGRDGVCPECGVAVAKSLPRERVGTAWQQQRGLGSLVSTWVGVLGSDSCWDEMQLDRMSRRSWLVWLRVVVYSVMLLGVWFEVAAEAKFHVDSVMLGYLFMMMVVPALVVEVFIGLYRWVGRLRLAVRMRFSEMGDSPAARDAMLDHATGGLLVIPVFWGLGAVLLGVNILIETRWNGQGSALAVGVLYSAFGVMGLGVVLGMVVYELMARRGWRAVRYRVLDSVERGESDGAYKGRNPDLLEEVDFDDWVRLRPLAEELFAGRPWMQAGFYAAWLIRYVAGPAAFGVMYFGVGGNLAGSIAVGIGVFFVLALVFRVVVLVARVRGDLDGRSGAGSGGGGVV